MQRARRLASIVVVATFAVGGLGACGFQPEVAARVGGGETVGEDRVQEIWDVSHATIVDKAPAASASSSASSAAEPVRVPYTRGDLVRAIVSRELYGRLAAEKGVTLPAGVPYDEAGAQFGLPGTDEFVRLYTENAVLQNALTKAVTSPAQPTDDEIRDVFDRIGAHGGIQPGTDFAAFSSALSPEDKTALSAALSVRRDVLALADKLDVEVSPRYQPLELGLLGVSNQSTGQSYSVVAATLGEDLRVPVADVS
ncbi:hypothetical protein [Actinoplanes derwentensis]|uniref:SurA N-terminal domain-containing protein n=1 Tax=Actinoplanes derwentensis TaxID=113562 RepID=A0A1H2CJD3_9ACTN|nr:hypothetical protein [Actinoplanes derwentensis]SDT70618.1 hypothetical protein SAMN04489716_5989 [Actinoplanes derwentensis]